MPFIGDNWVDERTAEARRTTSDPLRRASEKLAAAVENFLYSGLKSDQFAHPGYQNQDYLGWSLMQYDATKNGSGHRANYVEWSPNSDQEAMIAQAPVAPGAAGRTEAYMLPEHEKDRRDAINGPFEGDNPEADAATADRLANPDGVGATGPYFGPPPPIDPRTNVTVPADLGFLTSTDLADADRTAAIGAGVNDTSLLAPDAPDTDPGEPDPHRTKSPREDAHVPDAPDHDADRAADNGFHLPGVTVDPPDKPKDGD
jgi:hypothetical protein